MTASRNDRDGPRDHRRTLVLVVSIALLIGSFASWMYGSESSTKFATAAMGRIGLVLGALWLAWPSLRRPAQWLPPGIAMACLLALVILAAQPRLIVAVVPAVGALIALSMVVKAMRESK